MQSTISFLSLGELGCTTSALETVLLSLLHTRIAAQEPCCLKSCTVVGVSLKKCASKTVADSACLTGDTATGNGGDDIELAGGARHAEGLVYDELQGFKTEVIVNVAAVDGNDASARNDANTSNGFLSSAGAVEVRLCTCIHINLPSFPNYSTMGFCASCLCASPA